MLTIDNQIFFCYKYNKDSLNGKSMKMSSTKERKVNKYENRKS